MKKLCVISIMFWMVLVIYGCGDISNMRSLQVLIEIDTNFDAKMEIAKKVVQEVNIDLKERLLKRFPDVSKERLNTLRLGWGWEAELFKRTVFVEIEIQWQGKFKEAEAIIEYCASEVTKALKNV